MNSYKKVSFNQTQSVSLTYKNDSPGLLKMYGVCKKQHLEIHYIQRANLVIPVDISISLKHSIKL